MTTSDNTPIPIEPGDAGSTPKRRIIPIGSAAAQSPSQNQQQPKPEEETVELVDLEEGSGMHKIRAIGGLAQAQDHHKAAEARLKRRLNECPAGCATRCRTFHAKLNDASLAFMNNQINEWVDSNPEIAIKFATSTIGIVEGKHAEPHLIVTVFY